MLAKHAEQSIIDKQRGGIRRTMDHSAVHISEILHRMNRILEISEMRNTSHYSALEV